MAERGKKVIVIGAGVAGLTAGIYALKLGYRVEMFEKNALPGGECTGWDRGGYHIDNCIHWLMGTTPGSDLYDLYRETRLVDGEACVLTSEVMYESRLGGERLTLYSDLERTRREWLALSPADAAEIEALAPATPTYRALRQALLRYRSDAPAGGRATTNRLRTIEVNLERQRWLPRPLPADRVWVNAADQRLVLYRADRPVFSTRVVVGQDAEHNQSPEFRTLIEASFFNPPWVIPRDIVAAEILPKINRDPDYLTRNNMVMRANGEVEQLPGPDAGLGLIMFDMPNRFDVYLHDTPDRHIFSRDNRRISHGCIRVQNPREFAALLMQQPIDIYRSGDRYGRAHPQQPASPVPVLWLSDRLRGCDGRCGSGPDLYNRDADIGAVAEAPSGRSPPRAGRR